MTATSRVADVYRGGVVIPVVEPASTGADGLPHTPEGVIQTVERNWLGAEGATLVRRHIQEGSLQLERPNSNILSVNAVTVKGVACPIVWGVSIEGQSSEEDILEPHLLVPEGQEVVINISPSGSRRRAILGVYDQESVQPGMPPTRIPLLEKGGGVGMYVGNEIVFWRKEEWGHLRVSTPVTQMSGSLATIERGSAEVALHGGLYIMVVPEQEPFFNFPQVGQGSGAMGLGDTLRGGFSLRPDDLFDPLRGMKDPGVLSNDRPGGLSEGELSGRGGTTYFTPDITRFIPFILRVRAVGEMSSYLSPAGVAVNTLEHVCVRGAVCSFCGVSAPREAYQWKGDIFEFDQFDCRRCGGGSLEPVQYRRRA